MELGRFNKVLTHTLSPQQLAAGDDRRITFGISLARYAIYAASRSKTECGLADWVKLVLRKKGLSETALARFSKLYSEGIPIPVVNNIPDSG